jgi:hypothetical protein
MHRPGTHGGIQDSCHTEHTLGVDTCGLICAVSHHVKWIRYHHDDCVGRMFHDVLRYGAYDAGIGSDQIIAAHTGFAWQARGDYHNVGTSSGGVIVGAAFDTRVVQVDGRCLPHVEGFAFGNAFFDVEEDDFVAQLLVCNHIGAGGSYVTSAYYGYFHVVRMGCVISDS